MRLDTGTETVLAETTDGVGVVTLNRPERRNALHRDMCDAVPAILERFIVDPEVGCIVVTGAGAAFCAGGDVRDGAERRTGKDAGAAAPSVDKASAILCRNARMVRLLHESPKVTIAALPGPAVGAGLGIALAADLRIAARSARLIPGWGRLGFSGDFGGPWFLTQLVGASKAIELFVDNVDLDAHAALDLGLVNRVVADDELRGSTLAWARAIASGPRAAWTLFKANVREAERLPLAEALASESERMVRSGLTDDHRAAVKRWLSDATARGRPPT